MTDEVVTRIERLRSLTGGPPVFQKLHPDAVIPTRKYDDDIGWDLTVRTDRSIVIPPGEFQDLPCDLAVQLPVGSWGMLVGRSSALRKHGLLVNTGIIDEGYRGQLFAGAFNVGRKAVVVQNGWRLAQLIVVPRYEPFAFVAESADQLDASLRASDGFGSTGI
jgi:dUTP pyrophosphatase